MEIGENVSRARLIIHFLALMSERRSSTVCEVVERPEHHKIVVIDDLVSTDYRIVEQTDLSRAVILHRSSFSTVPDITSVTTSGRKWWPKMPQPPFNLEWNASPKLGLQGCPCKIG